MYLTRVELETKNRQKLKRLTHLGVYHGWIENCFPNEIKNHERKRHLWRIDKLGHKKFLLLYSEDKPDLENLNQFGIPNTAITKDYKPFFDNIDVQHPYHFRITANPVFLSGNHHVTPHVTVEQQFNWFIQQSKKNGFRIVQNGNPTFDITERKWMPLYHSGHRINLLMVSFEGLLTITDPELFKKALTSGIGREKSYGMGFLTIMP